MSGSFTKDRADIFTQYTQRDQRRQEATTRQLRACNKIPFPSKRLANGNIRAHPNALGMMAYKCKLCRRWHMGHSNRPADRGAL